MRLVILVPAPVVLAPGAEWGRWWQGRGELGGRRRGGGGAGLLHQGGAIYPFCRRGGQHLQKNYSSTKRGSLQYDERGYSYLLEVKLELSFSFTVAV